MKKAKLTTWIFFGMLGGIAVGWMCHAVLPTPEKTMRLPGTAKWPR